MSESSLKDSLARCCDVLWLPAIPLMALAMLAIRKAGSQRMPFAHRVLRHVGVFPIRDHYYEPLFRTDRLKRSLREDRALPGIDLNVQGQLELLAKFHYNAELEVFPTEPNGGLEYYYLNSEFRAGDSEFLYNMIRHFKPSRIIEIGSGNSTLMAAAAIRKNRSESPDYRCDHICIEPYEMPWLEELGVTVIREIVEDTPKERFQQLGRNDILFIDSSHMIRPQGDVLFEVLEILPILQPGVLVHVHDIFTPKDYPDKFVRDEIRFWNEQYLLEAFLTHNSKFKILGALNYLRHHHPDELTAKCPVLKRQLEERNPGSFWMVRL